MIFDKSVPYKKGNGFRICECEKCGDPVIASERDARELAMIFAYEIRKESSLSYKIRKALIHSLGGQL